MSEADEAMALAQACAARMWANDNASRGLGMQLESVAPGRARLSMTIRPDMTNGHGICHGGFIFALADSAFAFACNTHNRVTVAQVARIDFVRPGRVGEVLHAEAVEITRGGRSGVYDVNVRLADGTLVGAFRGNSSSSKKPVLEENEGENP